MISEVCHYLNKTKKKFCLKERIFTNTFEKEAERALQGECTSQQRLSEAEVEMDRKSWERKNSDIAPYETNQQLESQRLELYQANQWADQAPRQNIRLFGELSTKTESTKNITQEIVEKQRNYEEFAVSKRIESDNMKIDELSMQKKENPSTVNQLLSQIQELTGQGEFLE